MSETPEQIAERVYNGTEPASLCARIAAALQAERDRAEKAEHVARKLREGWTRVKDMAIAGNGPAECFAFQDAIRVEDSKCVEVVIRYLNDLARRRVIEASRAKEREMSDTDRLEYLIATGDRPIRRGEYWIVEDALARFTPLKRFATPRNAIDDAILNRWPTHWRNPERRAAK